MAEHCTQWERDQATVVSSATMSWTLARLQKKTLVAREQDATEPAAFRAALAALDPTTLIVRDAPSTPTTRTPLRARARRGERAVGRVPRCRRDHVTLIAALTPDGTAAPMLLPGALDRPAFEAWVAHEMGPALRPGLTVLLDHRSVHTRATARQVIEAAGCTLPFLPRSSPDDTPLEHAMAKIKHLLRTAAARTFAALLTAAQPAVDAITVISLRSDARVL